MRFDLEDALFVVITVGVVGLFLYALMAGGGKKEDKPTLEQRVELLEERVRVLE